MCCSFHLYSKVREKNIFVSRDVPGHLQSFHLCILCILRHFSLLPCYLVSAVFMNKIIINQLESNVFKTNFLKNKPGKCLLSQKVGFMFDSFQSNETINSISNKHYKTLWSIYYKLRL